MALLFKIPLKISPLFWLLAIFIGWMSTFSIMGTLLAVGIILVSVIIHELGHALTASMFNQKVRIELAAFGGFTYREGRKLKLWEEFLVVLNGPLAGFALGALGWLLYKYVPVTNSSLRFIFQFTGLVNLFWTLINLVPLLPLDGGHLLSIILEAIFGFKGIKMAILIGLIIGVACSIFFFAIGAFLIGALFLLLTFESFRSFKFYKNLTEEDRDAHIQELLKEAEADLQRGAEDSALNKFESVREKTGRGILYTAATQEIARIYKHEGRYEEAYKYLLPIKKGLAGENLVMLHLLAFKCKDYKTATAIGNEVYQYNPVYETALINALSNAMLGKIEPAIGWYNCAVRDGLPHPEEALSMQEFDPIRHSKEFQLLKK